MPNALHVKICGLTNGEDARAAIEAGADFLGFVLYAKSPRGITPIALRAIMAGFGNVTPKAIGVFVNETREVVVRIAQECGLHAVQIHGDEQATDFTALPVPVWRALSVRDGVVTPSPAAWSADRYVVDAAAPGQYGGTGLMADWTAAAALARRDRVMLAGGLTPENVAEAVRQVRPLGVDVSSGVEQSPGRKDLRKVAAFIAAARQAAADV